MNSSCCFSAVTPWLALPEKLRKRKQKSTPLGVHLEPLSKEAAQEALVDLHETFQPLVRTVVQ